MAGARTTFVLLSTAGLLLTGSGIAAASTSATNTAITNTAEETAYLRLDRTVAHEGDSVKIFARCGAGELLGLVGSEAFAPTGQDGPYEGNGGVARFTARIDDGLAGEATIRRDIAPGHYHVGQRCGGGNAGGLELTVIP
jgi:hypothetical protein